MTRFRSAARGVGAVLLLLAVVPTGTAQVKYPPLPDAVDVEIRYRIRANRDERAAQFRAMERNFKALGFERRRQPDDDLDVFDPTAERFAGTVPSENVFALLNDPRVQTVLFRRSDFKTPDDPAQTVPIRLWIATGYQPAEQQRLHRQVVAQLAPLGFREAIGYDHRRYTVVRGDLPSGNVFRLLKDLRREPAGWFASDTRTADLPSPLRDALPIRVAEVISDSDLSFLEPQPVPPDRAIFTPGLRALLEDQAVLAKPLRVEVVADRRPDLAELARLRGRFLSAYTTIVTNPTTGQRVLASATLEGVIGNVLTVQFTQASDVLRFAAEPGTAFIRLPRPAIETVGPVEAPAPVPTADVLAATRLDAFHRLGYRGRGTKIVVIGSDFPGLSGWLGVPFLNGVGNGPVSTIDLTAELSPDQVPAAPPANPSAAGTAAARAAHLAAPDASIVLVRVDPAAMFQLLTVARFARGERVYSEAMQTRLNELSVRADELRRRNAAAVAEYQIAFASASDEEGPRRRRQEAARVLDAVFAEEQALAEVVRRTNALQAALNGLAGTHVVINPLVWEAGYALDGLSELSQTIDTTFASEAISSARIRSATRPQPAPRPLWVQAASPSAGSVWGGPFLDADSNGHMEFAPPDQPIPRDEWTRELNFLATRGADGTVTPTLAAGSRVRLTVQWRETHDPTAYGGVDSIFPLTLRVFRQVDPEGRARASDELAEVARSAGGPYRLYAEPGYAVHEQIVEFAVPQDGRYCLIMEGLSVYDPRLPALRRQTQVNPRLFAEFLGAAPGGSRLTFASYASRNGGVAVPGDSKAAITVGESAAPLSGTPTGLTGAGTSVELLAKPDLLAYGALGTGAGGTGGPGVSAGFAGGVLAGLVGSGAPTSEILRATGLRRGGPVVIPDGWLRAVQLRTGRP